MVYRLILRYLAVPLALAASFLPARAQPSVPPGVDYAVPTETEIKATLDRIRDYFVRSTTYRIVDTQTGRAITDFAQPLKTAGVETFNDWDYPIGVALAGMLHIGDVTGDSSYRDYTLKNFDFIFDHLDYFRKQAAQFGPQATGYRRLLNMAALDDCGAIGAALIKAYAHKPDPRYRATIDAIADHIAHKQMRRDEAGSGVEEEVVDGSVERRKVSFSSTSVRIRSRCRCGSTTPI